MRFAVATLSLLISFSAYAEDHRYPGAKSSRYSESSATQAIPPLAGNYRVLEDLGNRENKNTPKTIDLYWDTEHKCPVVRITDADRKERKIILATFDDNRAGGSHAASVKASNDSVFRWVSKFNQASSIDNYLETTTTIEITKREGKTEITLKKIDVSTRYVDKKPQVETTNDAQHYLLEREK
jgi:hypothetical protein